jgi:hypothetical protein
LRAAPTGHRWATAAEDESLGLWELEKGGMRHLSLVGLRPHVIAWSSNGSFAAPALSLRGS